MKDGFASIEIEPTEGYLDFIGPAKSENNPNEPARVLRGEVRFTLTKSVRIRNMSVKFKGFSQITLQQQPNQVEITTPLLPKLKLPIFGRQSLPAGDHVIPWEMDIPNIYPRSLLIKRATINYKVIVSISTGLTRTLTAEYPIVLRRHLLPYKELAPIIETKLFQRTIPGKFHYEIDAPQIVCLEQEHIPMAIKYISFANQKTVQSIRTRLVQIELYRRQLSKSDSDLSCSNRDSQILDLDQKMDDITRHSKDTHIKYIKRTVPALIHIPDISTSAWKRPNLVRHRLHPYLSYTLDSPLVSIYHQIEVTFQFGAKFEEIKVKIPIIIASIPKKESLTSTSAAFIPSIDEMMMKYAFEEVAGVDFLPYRLENRSSIQCVTDDDLTIEGDDNYSVLRDTSIMPSTSDDVDEGQITGRMTSMMFINNNKNRSPPSQQQQSYFITNNKSSKGQYDLPNGGRRAFSPTPESSYHPTSLGVPPEEHRKLKKFASAYDLSTVVSQESCSVDEEIEPQKRPRTTTPTMRRQYMNRKALQPINVDLANRKDRGLLPPPPVKSEGGESSKSSSSDVLPATDRAAFNNCRNNNHSNTTATQNNRKNKTSYDDLRSVYSDTSMTSTNAPSLSSSATLSTNKSHPTLHSRPSSPVFSPAPGLPATIALRPQEIQTSQVEEMFPPDSANVLSPTMNTVASSTILSPRTSYAIRRRVALSTISLLTNDPLQLEPPRRRRSSTVDPDVQSLMRFNEHNSFDNYPPPPPNRYINARLPPIPTTIPPPDVRDSSKRQTKIYIDDSDDETEDERPKLPAIQPTTTNNNNNNTNTNNNNDATPLIVNNSIQDDCPPPRLPRLSFGGDFGISLGI